jgi:hypothetical protein
MPVVALVQLNVGARTPSTRWERVSEPLEDSVYVSLGVLLLASGAVYSLLTYRRHPSATTTAEIDATGADTFTGAEA